MDVKAEVMDMIEFLLARIAEDEERGRSLIAQWFDVGNTCQSCGTDGARVLAECDATAPHPVLRQPPGLPRGMEAVNKADGMAEATEADLDKAHGLWNEVLCNGGVPGWTATAAIAAALAEEREKARVPFLAVAEQYESHVRACEAEGLDSGDLAAAAVDIRRAAEEG